MTTVNLLLMLGVVAIDILLLIVSVLALVASIVAAAAALISLRHPKLEVAQMKLEHPFYLSFGGHIRVAQESYDGSKPDAILIVLLRNRGKVPALRISGSVHILNPNFCQPIDYPGYSNLRIQAAGSAAVYVVKILPSEENRTPAEPTYEPLYLQIPVKLHGADYSRIIYRFVPEQGAVIEGEWIVGVGGYSPGPPSPWTRPVTDSERMSRPPGRTRLRRLNWRKLFKRYLSKA